MVRKRIIPFTTIRPEKRTESDQLSVDTKSSFYHNFCHLEANQKECILDLAHDDVNNEKFKYFSVGLGKYSKDIAENRCKMNVIKDDKKNATKKVIGDVLCIDDAGG